MTSCHSQCIVGLIHIGLKTAVVWQDLSRMSEINDLVRSCPENNTEIGITGVQIFVSFFTV